ncbi:MAG: extracellular solute-binding protein [Clostridiaceae bacterium]|nr:extracellular solute-binding protein [Clostridiaceae bacterium]
MKKTLITILTVLLIAAMLTGCGQTSGGSTPATPAPASSQGTQSTGDSDSIYNPVGTYPIVKERIKLTILAPADGEYDRNENLFTKELEEKMNIDIEFTVAQPGAFKEKMNLMFASGDLTDIVATGAGGTDRMDKATEALLGSQGLIIPLNEYFDTVSIGYKEAFEQLPGLREFITTPDGNIYSLPNVDGSLHVQYTNKLWINTVWLDNLGLDMPTTTEEFYQVLKAFKEMDANGNGDPNDEIPLSSVKSGTGVQFDGFLMNPFILTPHPERMWVDNGKVIYSPIEEGYREGLAYLHRLYKEGLIYPESFTQDMKAQVNLNENGDVPVIGAFLALRPGYANDLSTLPNSKKWEQYQSLPPLKGPDGEAIAAWNPYAMYQTGIASITKDCKYPEAAFRLIDYIATPEGTLRTAEGIEGNGWRKATADEKGMDGRPAVFTQITEGKIENSGWGQLCGLVRTPDFVLSYAYPQDPYADDVVPLIGRQIVLYKGSLEHEKVAQPLESVLPELYYSQEQIDELALLKTTINDYVNSSVVRFITGDLDVEKDWESYLKQMKDLGVERYIEIVQSAYDVSSFKK